MKPALLWMEHVLGMEQFWTVQFHTSDVTGQRTEEAHGSGLRSIVMIDREGGVKFANNEPWRPSFKASQINIFNEDLRGDGVQHAAIAVTDILTVVKDARAHGVQFMPTPASYYDMLPARVEKLGIGKLDEEIATLRELEILVDGDGPKKYLLQIFMKDSAGLYGESAAGPFFYEIIQRKGDDGFGAGNFRALFESIEREQKREGRA
jgi:4-hydroxyphenylpyruvate dioxygenase